ncbi:MAG TPA: DNA polymerase III subunit beta [Microcoleaceae bacterium UBA10368]|jgi:DNA polymerase III, beta subunit|nr:DNA polymerase III subunit beta [Microcoleaceae cyanobacterium UBA10368]HCV28776.1 DNA polymerase III subunit beta [Microcoleaceae cyanobacterium UBA9251]
MKLVCTQSDLNTNLSLVSRAVPSRPTHPVLANVLLVADEENQRVNLTAFDLSLGIRTSFAAEVTGGGSFTIPAKLLNDIVSRLPDGEITLEDEAGDDGTAYIAYLTCSSGSYQVRGMGSEEFPELPAIEGGTILNLRPEALIEGLKGTLFATSPDEAKQVLAGVHLKVLKDCLEFAATDGHRLAVVQTANEKAEGEETEQEFEVTVPAKALREVERMLVMRQWTEPVTLHFEQGQVVFEWADQRLTTRTLEGQYPAYRQLIPPSFERQITMDRRSFLSAVERIAVFADQKNNILKCSINAVNQEITLSVDAQDVGSGKESLPAQISGESIDIAFNVKYLIDILKTAQSPEIQLQLNGALAPVIFQPLGGVNATFLVMPVQLRA